MMLADAVFAEGYRLSKNRAQILFSVLLGPVVFALGGIAFHILSKANGDKAAAAAGIGDMASSAPVNLADGLMFGANFGANGVALVLMLIGAATVYAGDYRWETWRLITARNDRVSLILGKVGVVKIMAAATMIAFLIASLIFMIAQAVVYERGMAFTISAGDLGKAAVVWLLSYVRIVQFAMIALLTAVMTRSLLAALFVPWALGFAQSILGQIMPLFGWTPDMWAPLLLLPGLDYDTLKAAVQPGLSAVQAAPGALPKALAGFALWTVLPLVAALAWFRRQDLSKE